MRHSCRLYEKAAENAFFNLFFPFREKIMKFPKARLLINENETGLF